MRPSGDLLYSHDHPIRDSSKGAKFTPSDGPPLVNGSTLAERNFACAIWLRYSSPTLVQAPNAASQHSDARLRNGNGWWQRVGKKAAGDDDRLPWVMRPRLPLNAGAPGRATALHSARGPMICHEVAPTLVNPGNAPRREPLNRMKWSLLRPVHRCHIRDRTLPCSYDKRVALADHRPSYLCGIKLSPATHRKHKGTAQLGAAMPCMARPDAAYPRAHSWLFRGFRHRPRRSYAARLMGTWESR